MIAPADPPLVRFSNKSEKLEYFRRWGIVSPKAKALIPVLYTGFYTDAAVPCEVIGHTWDNVAVIQIGEELHCIEGIYLADLQPTLKMLPRKKMPTVVSLSNYIVFDIETTGFSRCNDRILEISACRYEYNKKVDCFSSLVNPCMQIPSYTTHVHQITAEMVVDAPPFSEVSGKFLEFIGKLPLVGHNIASFDLPFLQEQLGFEIENVYYDTMRLAKDKFHGLKSYRLSALCDYLNIQTKPTHRAMQDVEATAALFWACVSKIEVTRSE